MPASGIGRASAGAVQRGMASCNSTGAGAQHRDGARQAYGRATAWHDQTSLSWSSAVDPLGALLATASATSVRPRPAPDALHGAEHQCSSLVRQPGGYPWCVPTRQADGLAILAGGAALPRHGWHGHMGRAHLTRCARPAGPRHADEHCACICQCGVTARTMLRKDDRQAEPSQSVRTDVLRHLVLRCRCTSSCSAWLHLAVLHCVCAQHPQDARSATATGCPATSLGCVVTDDQRHRLVHASGIGRAVPGRVHAAQGPRPTMRCTRATTSSCRMHSVQPHVSWAGACRCGIGRATAGAVQPRHARCNSTMHSIRAEPRLLAQDTRSASVQCIHATAGLCQATVHATCMPQP